MSGAALLKLLAERRIVLCGGSGGVGKTTTAAALGTLAAAAGRKTLVLTIDPARRLANAMGLDALGNEPQPVPQVANLSAMMLDAGATFDGLVRRYASDEATSSAILNNPYYRQFAATLAGSREFMAMEKVYELALSDEFDLLVVDTPPTQHALDFIDAPRRLTEILSGTGLSMILKTARLTNRLTFGIANKSRQQFMKLFEKLTGHHLLVDVSEFFDAFNEVFTDFGARATRLEATLRGADACFVLVIAPEDELVEQTHDYARRLRDEKMQVGAVVINRVHVAPPGRATAALDRKLAEALDNSDLAARAAQSLHDWLALAAADQAVIQRLTLARDVPFLQVPRLSRDISSMAALRQFAGYLAGKA